MESRTGRASVAVIRVTMRDKQHAFERESGVLKGGRFTNRNQTGERGMAKGTVYHLGVHRCIVFGQNKRRKLGRSVMAKQRGNYSVI